MAAQIGLILTSASDLATLRRHTAALRADVLKVVAGWGLPWDATSRRDALRLAPATIVRTLAGDPSYQRPSAATTIAPAGYGPHTFPHWEQVVEDAAPWYDVADPARPIWIEIGNEPLLDPLAGLSSPDEDYAWNYRAYLHDALLACRRYFPRARLIAPAHIENHPIRLGEHANGQARMTEICADVLRQFDALGLHAYSLEQYVRGMGRLRSLVSSQPVWLTEFALNERLDDAARGRQYAATLRQFAVAGVTLYHLDEAGGSDPAHFQANYRLTPATLESFASAWRAPATLEPAPSPATPTSARPPVTNIPMTRAHLTRGRAHGPVAALVIHATAGKAPSDFNWLRQGGSTTAPVSVHYYITKAGAVTQFVADHDTAWHAGASRWRGLEVQNSLNARSIGIELENLNTGRDPYPGLQYRAAVALARHLMHRYQIPRENLVRHLDISPGRKSDPAGFPWAQFVADVHGAA